MGAQSFGRVRPPGKLGGRIERAASGTAISPGFLGNDAVGRDAAAERRYPRVASAWRGGANAEVQA
jgi:hypothetical protein